MKFAAVIVAGALALSSSFAMAQAAGAGSAGGSAGTAGGAPSSGSTGAAPPSGNPPGSTIGQVKPGAMGNPNAPMNPSGNSYINTSPSGSTVDQTGTGSNRR